MKTLSVFELESFLIKKRYSMQEERDELFPLYSKLFDTPTIRVTASFDKPSYKIPTLSDI